jgi:putative GTP pyrophosphokinase
MDQFNFNRIAKSISEDIESEINRIGLFYRIFYRVKTSDSINRKLAIKNYTESEKKMQDLIGIRIVAYFKDDVDLLINTLKSKFDCIDTTIDQENDIEFQPTRINLVFKMPREYSEELFANLGSKRDIIDNTYEIQIRTIFSEGWHEVEHDLRYKCKEEWNDQIEYSRILNGIYASLETTDWSIMSLFDQLAYSNYMCKNVVAMIRNKFRIRFTESELSLEIIETIISKDLLKKIYRFDRTELLNYISINSLRIPLKMTNIVLLINYLSIKDQSLSDLTNPVLKDSFKKSQEKEITSPDF